MSFVLAMQGRDLSLLVFVASLVRVEDCVQLALALALSLCRHFWREPGSFVCVLLVLAWEVCWLLSGVNRRETLVAPSVSLEVLVVCPRR